MKSTLGSILPRTAGRRAKVSNALLAVLVITGCAAVGPDYRKPDLPLPAAWQHANMSKGVTTVDRAGDLSRWWQRLGDPTLSVLIERALQGSTDLKSAQARLREARACRALAGANLFHTVTASAAGSRSKGSAQAGSGKTTHLYSIGFALMPVGKRMPWVARGAPWRQPRPIWKRVKPACTTRRYNWWQK